MNPGSRVVVNTTAQYIRTFISVIVSLYTSRVVLDSLGQDDFGIYSVVGGVVAMLAFIKTSLAQTTQRYLSFNYGKQDTDMVQRVFNNSLFTQLLISVLLCGTLLALTVPVTEHMLKIPADRMQAAKVVYYLMIANIFVDMQSTPYLAALVARENIVYSSIVQILDSLLKIPIAVSLMMIAGDRLKWYSFMLFGICIVNYICYRVYCMIKYPECRKTLSFKTVDKNTFREMFSFMGWNMYGSLCAAGRSQGIAVLLNNFFTTAVNAAYGIGNSFFGQISFLSNALCNAINPRIIKAEGSGNRARMLRLSEMSCKFSFLLLTMAAIPAFVYMDTILSLWLKEVPEYTAIFCNYIMLATLLNLLSANFSTANQAVGDVRRYNLYISTIRILTIPVVWLLLWRGCGVKVVMICFMAFELAAAVVRVIYMHLTVGLSYRSYCRNVLLPVIPVVAVNLAVCWGLSRVLTGWWFLLTSAISVLVTGGMTLLAGLSRDERGELSVIWNRVKGRFGR